MDTRNCLINNIFHNTIFSVQQEKETDSGLEQLKEQLEHISGNRFQKLVSV